MSFFNVRSGDAQKPARFRWVRRSIVAISVVAVALGSTALPASAETGAAEPVAAAAVAGATTYLPFDMPSTAVLRSSPKKVFAHYVPWSPISYDNKPGAIDYYAKNYLDPNGEAGKYLHSVASNGIGRWSGQF